MEEFLRQAKAKQTSGNGANLISNELLLQCIESKSQLPANNEIDSDSILGMMRARAKLDCIDNKKNSLITDDEFFQFCRDMTWNGEASAINYDTFCDRKLEMPEKFQGFFKPSIYLIFKQNDRGEITIDDFLRYIYSRVCCTYFPFFYVLFYAVHLGTFKDQWMLRKRC